MPRNDLFTQLVAGLLGDLFSLPFGGRRRGRVRTKRAARAKRPRKTDAELQREHEARLQRADEAVQRAHRGWEKAHRGYINAVIAILRNRHADLETKRGAWAEYAASIHDPNMTEPDFRSRAVELARQKGLEKRALDLGFDPLPDA